MLGEQFVDYPLKAEGQEVQWQIGANGLEAIDGQEPIVNYLSIDKMWRITLTRHFLTLSTREYQGHDNFIQRFASIARRVIEVLGIEVFSRIGYRYVNCLSKNDEMNQPQRLFQPFIVGMADTPAEIQATACMNQAQYEIDGGFSLVARSGIAQQGTTADDFLPPFEDPTWVFDLDASKIYGDTVVDWDALAKDIIKLSDIDHDFFRVSITDDYVHRYAIDES